MGYSKQLKEAMPRLEKTTTYLRQFGTFLKSKEALVIEKEREKFIARAPLMCQTR